jgi:DNA-binding response OmpR family regulator
VDYITKPFRLAELLARVRAHLRHPQTAGTVAVGPLVVDQESRRVWSDGVELDLTAKEFDLLSVLVNNAGRVMTRDRLMAEVWDENWFGSTKTLDVHVASLRRKMGEPPGEAGCITTLRGVGYRFESVP